MSEVSLTAQELRMGNFLDRNGLMEVVGIVKDNVKVYDHYNKVQLQYFLTVDTFSGIPLNEEWLIKLGFEKTIEVTWSFGYHKEYNVYRKYGLTYNGIQAAWWYHGLLKNQPDYVHQLQNLYFALTGEELKLSEPTIASNGISDPGPESNRTEI